MKISILIMLLLIFGVFSCDKTEMRTPIVTVEKPVFSINDTSIIEGDNKYFEIKVKLSGKHPNSILIPYYTLSGLAEPFSDYEPIDGILEFVGTDSLEAQSIFIEIKDDDIFEENEDFKIVFTIDSSVIAADTILSVSIIDDDIEFTDNDYPGYVTKLHQEGWTLILNDEFSGNKLNKNHWYVQDRGNWYNEEVQYYSPQNLKIENGLLTFIAKKENYKGSSYTSARINSRDKMVFKYGKIEFRAKLPYSKGLWPALWLQGNELYQLGWPKRGEIDIMELKGHIPNTISSTIHYADLSGNHKYPTSKKYTLPKGEFKDEFHVFTMKWDEYKLKFYVDDKLYNTIFHNNFHYYNNKNPFKYPFYVIMNVAVGGNFGGDPDATTVWPQTMDIDYVRIYKEN